MFNNCPEFAGPVYPCGVPPFRGELAAVIRMI